MTDHEIYLAAAEQIASCEDRRSCIEISNQSGRSGGEWFCRAREKYSLMFEFTCPDDTENTANDNEVKHMPNHEKRNLRVMLLCMAAAVEKAGGL